ncbi:MAG: hypothetical protein D6820_16720, partial [Lentisphaerae bacterium]
MQLRFCAWMLISSFLIMGGMVQGETVWIEGEKPDALPVLKDGTKAKPGKGFVIGAWGNTSIMSGQKVLHVNIPSSQAAALIGDNGLIFGYHFTLSRAGDYNIWLRIGYEWVRSQFDWRIDGGSWHTVSNTTPTVNIQPIQTWNELAWLNVGKIPLKAGKHRLEIRHRAIPGKNTRGKTKPPRILHILDVICVTNERFEPCGKWRPGEDHRNATDRQAEKQIFRLNTKEAADLRCWTELNGLWQYAGWEERKFPIPEETRLAPVKTLPDLNSLRWFGLKLPGGREQRLPHEVFTHRYLLRTRFEVPKAFAGRGFFLDVQRSNFIISVFVNGHFAGWTDTFHTAWQMDLTPWVRAGDVNELVLCVKDAYYSLNPKGDPSAAGLGNRRYWNLPLNFLHSNQGVASKHDYPIAADVRSGILEPASIVVCGPVYTADVFCQPSVKRKELKLDITVFNAGPSAGQIQIENKVIPWNEGKGGAPVLQFPARTLRVPGRGNGTLTVSQSWPNPRLWWPDNPYLYVVETTIRQGTRVIDRKRTRFGFRELDWSSHMIRINGVKWPMWADTNYGKSPQAFVKQSRTLSHQNQIRYWRNGGWAGMTRRECLDFFDET